MVSESIENINFASKVKVKVKSLSCIRLFATLWTVARQAPLSMGFSRQEYWSGLPFPAPGDLHYPEVEPVSLASLEQHNKAINLGVHQSRAQGGE